MQLEATQTETADVSESREHLRFAVPEMLEAHVAGQSAVVRDLSVRGIGLRHAAQVKVGAIVTVRIESAENETAAQARCRVVWSRLSRFADERGRAYYDSGLLIVDDSPAIATLMERMIRAHGEGASGSLDEKRRRIESRALGRFPAPEPSAGPRITREHALRVHEAIVLLESDPASATKWHARALQSLVALGILATASDPPPHNRAVLVIWEYLDRALDLELVASLAGLAGEG